MEKHRVRKFQMGISWFCVIILYLESPYFLGGWILKYPTNPCNIDQEKKIANFSLYMCKLCVLMLFASFAIEYCKHAHPVRLPFFSQSSLFILNFLTGMSMLTNLVCPLPSVE